MISRSDLFYDVWEVLSPKAFCDREGTDWTDEVMTVVMQHLEEAGIPVDKEGEINDHPEG